MTESERTALRKKYGEEECRAFRSMFDEDVQAWSDIQTQMDKDLQCISTDREDGSPAGPWPEQEWAARRNGPHKRPCLHEDVLTQYCNQVSNQIELNPMGVECQPLGDGADEKSAEFLEGRIRNIEYEEHAPIAYLAASNSAIQCSVGAWILETQKTGDGTQKVCIEEVQDIRTIVPGFFKKAAGADMRRCWQLDRMTWEEFKRRYPKAQVKDFDSWGYTAGQWVDSEQKTIQVAALWHLEEDDRFLLTINGPEGQIQAYEDEFESGVKDLPGEVVSREPASEKRRRVLKTVFNGIEALDETEWLDPGDGEAYPPEIPVILVTGRIKYEKGRRVIESLVRKGRVGQLLYDYTISAIQETIALTPKVKYAGFEGSFDTSSNFNPKAPGEYIEFKPVVAPESAELLPMPILQTYEPPIQALELAKQSILIGIQNAIGMSSIERKDREAKSGKALEAMQADLAVGTAHFFGSLRVAQERQYRILQRILPLLEAQQPQVPIRDKFGKHSMTQPLYQGRHSLAVGTGKLYQTLQEKQEETADQLMQIKDPNVLLAVLPGAIRMRGLGEYGDEIAAMIESIQPPQMQAARDKDNQIPPEAMQAINQAQEALRGLDAYAKQLERQIIELEEKINGKVVENQTKEKIAAEDNLTKIKLEEMKFEHEKQLKQIELMIERLRASVTFGTKGAELDSKERMQSSEHQHASQEAEATRQHASSEADVDRSISVQQADADRSAAVEQAALSAKEKGE